MLVYGDHSRRVDPRDMLADIEARWLALSSAPGGVQRHAALVAVFIGAGELLQGLADDSFKRLGLDDTDQATELATALCRRSASAVAASWNKGFAASPLSALAEVEALRSLGLPETVEVKLAEGYAFYALYPELYVEAAGGIASGADVQTMGIRSIGAGLAAMISAATEGPPPITVRPTGHPYDRRVTLGPGFHARLEAKERFAVVDEGPGMSGSSFSAVLQVLAAQHVQSSQIHLFPSHAGEPGPAAGPERRAAYLAVERRVASFEDVLLSGARPALARWVEDLTGPAVAPLEDISGGGWRGLLLASEEDWPAVWSQQERRKFLIHGPRGTFLLRFVGLGETGEHRLDLARALAQAGWSNPPLGLRHGFLVEPWLGDARPLSVNPTDRTAILDRLPAYLAWRGCQAPPQAYTGASLGDLFEMLSANAVEALGPQVAARVQVWGEPLVHLQQAVRPVAVDGRLHPWEWLRLPDGRIWKSDAVDHHLAHDLIGPQDISWDLAGAAVEFDLSPRELERLRDDVGGRLQRQLDRPLLDFMRLAYAAFQMGRCVMARQTASGSEAQRLDAEAARYRAALGLML